MRKIYTLAIITMALLCSCEREHEIGVRDNDTKGDTITAVLEQPSDTKTEVQEDYSVFWEPSEEIKVFCGSKSAKFTSLNTEPSASVTFKSSGSIISGTNPDIWALYPYDEDATFADGIITTTIPCDQVAAPGTFARNTNVTIAHSTTTSLQFYNVCGGVRFSVTEEGINKVIFEGLAGEAIAGKVQIGIDDNGLPYIDEVLEGRMFITLTPPSGATFEPGQWYYLSALPGTLEKGYKMRFYKDDTYGKVVSENSVTVKRGIFGSLADADNKIEDVIISTTFPETTEDIESACTTVEELAPTTDRIIKMIKACSTDGTADPEIVVKEIAKIDGVVEANVTESGNVIIKTIDNLFVNVIVNYEEDLMGDMDEITSYVKTNAPLNNVTSPLLTSNAPSNAVMPKGKKAIMLIPVLQETITKSRKNPSHPDEVEAYVRSLFDQKEQILKKAGYEVDRYDNSKASLDLFRGENLQQYDIIFLWTHGGYDLVTNNGKTITTGFQTASKSSWFFADQILDGLHYGSVASCIIEDESYYYMTAKAMEEDAPHFNNSWFFANACNSATTIAMSSVVFSCGAAGYNGYTNKASMWGSNFISSYMFMAFASGMEFNAATDWTKNNARDYYYGDDISSQLAIFKGLRAHSEPFHIVNPTPTNLQSSVDGSDVSLSWDIPQTAGVYEYRIVVDGKLQAKTLGINYVNRTSASYTASESGTHTWYVQADLFIDGEKVTSFKSEEETFVVNLGTPILKLSDEDYPKSFPDTEVGDSQQSYVTISNIGDGILEIKSITFDDNSPFSTDLSSFTLEPGASRRVHIWFKPTTTGNYQNGMVFTSNSIPGGEQSLPLLGCAVSYTAGRAKDLGLSVKWADCNVGATKPYEFGAHFAWGETNTKSKYEWSTYFDSKDGINFSKYYNCGGKVSLDDSDDVARTKWGGKWRTPTYEECQELIEKCSWTCTTQNGVPGYIVTSNVPGYMGVSIFLPTAGRWEGTSLRGYSSNISIGIGYYWASSIFDTFSAEESMYGNGLFFVDREDDYIIVGGMERWLGFSVRPVCDK